MGIHIYTWVADLSDFLTESTPSRSGESPVVRTSLNALYYAYMDPYPHIGLLICQNFWTESSNSINGKDSGMTNLNALYYVYM